MEQPMLSVAPRNGSAAKATPNLLPCRIHHDGEVGETKPYWIPSTNGDGKKVAYFRGRELHGKALKVPQGYRGVVVEKREAPKPDAPRRDEDEAVDVDAEEDEEEMPLGALETKAEFEEMVIWGHETMADAAQDPYVRSVEEWVQLSEQMHAYDEAKEQ